MATCQSVIKRALRMLGALAAGREPDAADAADCLQALRGLYAKLVSDGTLGRLNDVLVSADYTAGENERVINTSGGPITITLPTTISDASSSVDQPWPEDDYDGGVGSTRAVRDRSVVIEAGTTPRIWLFDANMAAWVEIGALTLTDEAPLSARMETGLACLLAVHVAAEFRDSPPPATVIAGASQAMSALVSRWDSPRFATEAEYF